MIYSIEGKIEVLAPDKVAVKIGDGASSLQISALVPTSLVRAFNDRAKQVKLLTHLIWRDTGPTLFGFESASQVALFEQLNDVSGVGPKTALALIDKLGEEGLINAVHSEDFQKLAQVAGVGKKTAQRIVIDLKGKVSLATSALSSQLKFDAPLHQAEQALIHLGYSPQRAKALLQRAQELEPSADVSELIAFSLRLGTQGSL